MNEKKRQPTGGGAILRHQLAAVLLCAVYSFMSFAASSQIAAAVSLMSFTASARLP